MIEIDDIPEEYLLASELDAEVRLAPGIERSHDQVAIAGLLHQVRLIHLGKEASLRHAQSWRDFKVGAAAVGFSLDVDTPRLVVAVGANVKPAEETDINIHAEMMALAKLRRRGIPWVSSMAVFGPVQPDTQSGVPTKTLHMCGLCRDAMQGAPEVNGDTLLLSGTGDYSVCEVYDLQTLIDHHALGGHVDLRTIDLSQEALDSGKADLEIAQFVREEHSLRYG